MYTIAEHMRDVLVENNLNNICIDNKDEILECAKRCSISIDDPFPTVYDKVFQGLERNQKLFDKGYYMEKRRLYRNYILK